MVETERKRREERQQISHPRTQQKEILDALALSTRGKISRSSIYEKRHSHGVNGGSSGLREEYPFWFHTFAGKEKAMINAFLRYIRTTLFSFQARCCNSSSALPISVLISKKAFQRLTRRQNRVVKRHNDFEIYRFLHRERLLNALSLDTLLIRKVLVRFDGTMSVVLIQSG